MNKKKIRLGLLMALCVIGGAGVTAGPADGRSPKAAPQAQDRVTEVILARRNLMAAIGRNMDGITGMVEPGGKIDPADAAEHADEIAVMLQALPHLFPPGSERWSAELERRDPAIVSEALPAVWKESEAFRRMAQAASQIATDASRSADEAQFRLRAEALNASCMACHTHFRREEKAYVIPIAPR